MTTAETRLRSGGMTIREVAAALNISPARVRAIEEAALRKLQMNRWALRRLREFVDFSTIRAEEGSDR